jgi:general secretion pathway protein K
MRAAAGIVRQMLKQEMQHRHHQQGIALVIVLWVVTLLSLIAASFIYAMRTDVQIVSNSMSITQGQVIADAGVHRAMLELYKPIQVPDRWNPNGEVHEWEYKGAKLRITIMDESGKIDINGATEALLRSLFVSKGVPEEEANTLVDAINDWKDPDILKRLRGAEEPEYKAAGLTYKPANAPFQAQEELRLVLGMTSARYKLIEDIITVYSRQPGVDAKIASREVLLAIPNVTVAQVDEYIGLREQARATKQFVPPFSAGGPYLSVGSGFIASVRSEATMPDGVLFIRNAVVMKAPNPKRPYVFLSWKEGTAGATTTVAPSVAAEVIK